MNWKKELRDLFNFNMGAELDIPTRLHLPLTFAELPLKIVVEGTNTLEKIELKDGDKIYAQSNVNEEPSLFKVKRENALFLINNKHKKIELYPEQWTFIDTKTNEVHKIGDLIWLEK